MGTSARQREQAGGGYEGNRFCCRPGNTLIRTLEKGTKGEEEGGGAHGHTPPIEWFGVCWSVGRIKTV
jgi:hypothetical protein